MREIKFNAILSKNCIARELRNFKNFKEKISVDYVIARLQEIENFIGVGNQPNINSILKSNLDI